MPGGFEDMQMVNLQIMINVLLKLHLSSIKSFLLLKNEDPVDCIQGIYTHRLGLKPSSPTVLTFWFCIQKRIKAKIGEQGGGLRGECLLSPFAGEALLASPL